MKKKLFIFTLTCILPVSCMLGGCGKRENVTNTTDTTSEDANIPEQSDEGENLFNLGEEYYKIREYEQAYNYYYEAATTYNYGAAYGMLGEMYINGYGVEKDYSKALEYYEKGRALGDSDSICNLAICMRKDME